MALPRLAPRLPVPPPRQRQLLLRRDLCLRGSARAKRHGRAQGEARCGAGRRGAAQYSAVWRGVAWRGMAECHGCPPVCVVAWRWSCLHGRCGRAFSQEYLQPPHCCSTRKEVLCPLLTDLVAVIHCTTVELHSGKPPPIRCSCCAAQRRCDRCLGAPSWGARLPHRKASAVRCIARSTHRQRPAYCHPAHPVPHLPVLCASLCSSFPSSPHGNAPRSSISGSKRCVVSCGRAFTPTTTPSPLPFIPPLRPHACETAPRGTAASTIRPTASPQPLLHQQACMCCPPPNPSPSPFPSPLT